MSHPFGVARLVGAGEWNVEACRCVETELPSEVSWLISQGDSTDPFGAEGSQVWLETVQQCSRTAREGSSEPAGRRFTVKRLWIGMPIQEAADVLAEEIPEALVRDWSSDSIAKEMGLTGEGLVVRPGPIPSLFGGKGADSHIQVGSRLEVAADDDGRVTSISLDEEVVNQLFNASDLDVTQFVREFASGYQIDQVDFFPSTGSFIDESYWQYDHPLGTRIRISGNKRLKLEKIVPMAERRFD